MDLQWYRPHDQFAVVRIMGKDSAGITRALQIYTIAYFRERSGEEADRVRCLVSIRKTDAGKDIPDREPGMVSPRS
jgi:hypothetical protein